jgi:RNA polymerase sigma-70 factor (ECF subfamily)
MATDAQLIEDLRADDGDGSLRELYRAYAPELFGFALRTLGERGAAEEVVQEVFIRAWRNADRYDPQLASVRTWLYGITRNALIDAHRRASVRPSMVPVTTEPGGGETIEQAMLSWQISTALDGLSHDHREVIRLAHLRGLSMREIAEMLDLPLGTVKSRTWYALQALRLSLEEMGLR